ncbi:MAG: ComEA family DNA-binding protein [Ilumatobacteraceae bacterium]
MAAVAGGGFWLLRAPPTAVESTLPFAGSGSGLGSTPSSVIDPLATATIASSRTESSTSSVAPAVITVYVTGAVVMAGVYALQADARVQDAVVAAGGMANDADGEAVNLAGFLVDGARLYIPRVGVPVPPVVTPSGGGSTGGGSAGGVSGGGPTTTPGPIDLNTATAEQLDALPGIGPSTAAAIVEHRESSGPYATIDDLLAVRGIGPAKLDAIRELITV